MKHPTSKVLFVASFICFSILRCEQLSNFNYIEGTPEILFKQNIINDANAFKKMLLRGLKNVADYKEFPTSEAQINAYAFELAFRLHLCTSGKSQECRKIKHCMTIIAQVGKFDDADDQSEEASLLKFIRDRASSAE